MRCVQSAFRLFLIPTDRRTYDDVVSPLGSRFLYYAALTLNVAEEWWRCNGGEQPPLRVSIPGGRIRTYGTHHSEEGDRRREHAVRESREEGEREGGKPTNVLSKTTVIFEGEEEIILSLHIFFLLSFRGENKRFSYPFSIVETICA